MNEYKQAWYTSTLIDVPEHPRKMMKSAKQMDGFVKLSSYGKQKMTSAATGAGMAIGMQAAKYAARSQLTGTLGVSLRVGGRVGLRVIPVVGVALLAYDLYQFGKWVTQD